MLIHAREVITHSPPRIKGAPARPPDTSMLHLAHRGRSVRCQRNGMCQVCIFKGAICEKKRRLFGNCLLLLELLHSKLSLTLNYCALDNCSPFYFTLRCRSTGYQNVHDGEQRAAGHQAQFGCHTCGS